MALQLNTVNSASDTFEDHWDVTNQLVNALATEVVTVNTHSNGALTIGNGYVSGIFGATKLVATSLVGGSVAASANVSLQSNLVGNSSITLQLGNSSVYATMNSSVVNTTSVYANAASISYLLLEEIQMGNTIIQDIFVHQGVSSPLLVDSWLLSGFRSAEYLVSLSDLAGNNYGCTKLLVVQGNGAVLITEYAQLYSNGSPIGVFSANANATHTTVWFTTGGSTNANISATKTMLRL